MDRLFTQLFTVQLILIVLDSCSVATGFPPASLATDVDNCYSLDPTLFTSNHEHLF